MGYTKTPQDRASIQLNNMLYVPEACKWLFSLIVARQHGSISETTGTGTTVSKNGTPYIIGRPTGGKLHVFELELVKKKIPGAIIATLSDYTLWHRRMGHAHQRIIKHLDKNTEGGPHQTTKPPSGICEGCEMGKSKRLPFPTSKSRAKRPLDLVHSDLDEMSDISIGGYKYTATYLDNYSSFGVIFYLKKKSDEFTAFKQYKAWAEQQLDTTLKCR